MSQYSMEQGAGKKKAGYALFSIVLLFSFFSAALARDPAQVRAFRKLNPCPATGKTAGACPGWVVDHRVPLCAGGPDTPKNMQWQKRDESLLKDKWERELCAWLKRRGPAD